jgi:hypothetical protein
MIIHWAFCCDPDDFGWGRAARSGSCLQKNNTGLDFLCGLSHPAWGTVTIIPSDTGLRAPTWLGRPFARRKPSRVFERGLAWLSLESGSRLH